MKIELAMFKSTIAKKIFFLFILSALIPVTLFAFFSIRQVERVMEDNVLTQLQEDARNYVYTLNERLIMGELVMKQLVSGLKLNPDTQKWLAKDIYHSKFSSLSMIENYRTRIVYWGEAITMDQLSADEMMFLQQGKSLLQVISNGHNDGSDKIIMISLVSSQSSQDILLIGEVNPNQLWGNEESFDLRKSFCVVNQKNLVLFCSKSEIQNTIRSMISEFKLKSRGKLSWSDKQFDIYVGYSSIFLNYNFLMADWKIVFAQAKQESSYRQQFNLIFYSIVAFTLVVVIYISLLKIRQQMKPLDALMHGISRLSSNDFSQAVPVLGNDEFGKLATEFNLMSDQLKTQLNVLATLADIDQLILSSLTTQDIIKLVLSRANDVIKSDLVSFTLLAKDNANHAIVYFIDNQDNNRIIEGNYQISSETLQEISEKRLLQIERSNNQWNDSIKPLLNAKFSNFLIIPVGYKEDNSAFITFAYNEKNTQTEDVLKWGQEFADRIAVAINNASWEKQLYQQAHFDSLTGLPNRLLFLDRLQNTINQCDRDGPTPVVLVIDLDKFKSINDSLGHSLGDNLIKQIAQRINLCIRKSDTVARIGGDEFVVLLDKYYEPDSLDLVITIKKILSTIYQPIFLLGNELRVTASIGVAIYPRDGDNMEVLLKNADTAVNQAKKLGKGKYQLYSTELNASMLKTLLLEADLHKALENNEFQLFYQPQVETKTGLIVGAEALIRWRHPDRGLISPFEFIPLIEQSGLIIPVGAWVINEASQQNKKWQQKGLPKIRVAINLSSKQFNHTSLFSDIKQVLSETELGTEYIEIEITEGTAMDDFNESIALMKKIRDLGIEISIDDYGTGYSSLEYIKEFPVDTLKIDRAFIIDLVTSYREKAIVKSTIIMAHELGLKVIAEGVEDEQQRSLLEQMGCDFIQGYYFSKPVPAEDFETLLAKSVIMPNNLQESS